MAWGYVLCQQSSKSYWKHNVQKVQEFISNASASEVIQIQNLKLEALSTLSLCQVKYQQLMCEDRQLSTEAVNLISEYVDNFPRKENTNLEPDNAHDDDSNNDDDDDDAPAPPHLPINNDQSLIYTGNCI